MSMVTKALKRKEVEMGFVRIPSKNRSDLLGDFTAPFITRVNDFPAKVDKQGRIWCSEYLKNKFPINSEVTVSKRENGFVIVLNGKQESSINGNIQTHRTVPKASDSVIEQKENSILIPNLESTSEVKVLEGDCIKHLNSGLINNVDLTFFDPPYLQGKDYRFFDDNQSAPKYWNWIRDVVQGVYDVTSEGGAIYFMHREKNAEKVLQIVRETGWTFQNLIIWKKKTSAIPIETRFSKQYQIIVYAIKGKKPRVFNKLRIDPPPLPEHKYLHENGVYLTDVWDDIRELTSGYFAGDEAYRDKEGNRIHIQQTPVALLLRIILSSTLPGALVLDPTAGTGTALVVAKQLSRNCVGIEIDPSNVHLINNRLASLRESDSISRYSKYYKYTPNLKEIWQTQSFKGKQQKLT